MNKIISLFVLLFFVAVTLNAKDTKEVKKEKNASCCMKDGKAMKTSDAKSEACDTKSDECKDEAKNTKKGDSCDKDAKGHKMNHEKKSEKKESSDKNNKSEKK